MDIPPNRWNNPKNNPGKVLACLHACYQDLCWWQQLKYQDVYSINSFLEDVDTKSHSVLIDERIIQLVWVIAGLERINWFRFERGYPFVNRPVNAENIKPLAESFLAALQEYKDAVSND